MGLGNWIKFVEVTLRPKNVNASNAQLLTAGVLAWCVVVIPVVVILCALVLLLPKLWAGAAILLIVYFSIAPRSLAEHAVRVYRPLAETTPTPHDLASARKACAMIVSRDTAHLSASELATASVETVVENANDAVIAPLFWFFIAGLPGVVLFRVANTLDAMWGYRSSRYLYFGRFAARVDDVLGYIPARLTVALFSLIDSNAYAVARRDGRRWYSPNAGPVMAAGAGALRITLGGAASYDGNVKARPTLGSGRGAEPRDIPRALNLVKKSYLILLGFMLTLGALL